MSVPERLTPTQRPTYMVTCGACNGTGRSRYTDGACCDRCDGLGKVLSYSPNADVRT